MKLFDDAAIEAEIEKAKAEGFRVERKPGCRPWAPLDIVLWLGERSIPIQYACARLSGPVLFGLVKGNLRRLGGGSWPALEPREHH